MKSCFGMVSWLHCLKCSGRAPKGRSSPPDLLSSSHLNFRLSDSIPKFPHTIDYWFREQGPWKAPTWSSCLTKICHLSFPSAEFLLFLWLFRQQAQIQEVWVIRYLLFQWVPFSSVWFLLYFTALSSAESFCSGLEQHFNGTIQC